MVVERGDEGDVLELRHPTLRTINRVIVNYIRTETDKLRKLDMGVSLINIISYTHRLSLATPEQIP